MNPYAPRESNEEIDANVAMQKNLLLELNRILLQNDGIISIKDGYNFVDEKKDKIFIYDFIRLESELKKDSKSNKEILNLLNNVNFLKYVDRIKEQINSDNLTNSVSKIVEGYEMRVSGILSYQEVLIQEKEIIKKGNLELQNTLIMQGEALLNINSILEEFGIESNKQLLDNLKNAKKLIEIFYILEERGTFKKGNEIVDVVRKMQDSHEAFESFINKLVEANLLVRVNNHKGLPKINSVALDAVSKTKIINTNETSANQRSQEGSSTIIKAGDSNIEKYTFGELKKDESKNIEIYYEQTIDLMQEQIDGLKSEQTKDKQDVSNLSRALEQEKETSEELRDEVLELKAKLEEAEKFNRENHQLLLQSKLNQHKVKKSYKKED